MHSCRAEKVLRKQRQEFVFDWSKATPDVEGSVHPAATKTPKKKATPAGLSLSPFRLSCGQCDSCLEMHPEYCRLRPA